ncbi:MAG: efflux RND transporter permease subunit, partial [Armatimonadetes bacterium]|nr:efflux RND transporter permease subunit [Armatimonadota bacterium]
MSERQPNDLDHSRAIPEATPGSTKMWLSDLSIRQPVFITMLVLAVVVVGGLLYPRLGLDFLPDASLPVVVVRTVYPGANPLEVERSVTKPIEDAVFSLNGVENVRSTTLDSVSLVIVEFNLNKNAKEAMDDVRTRVSAIRTTLPADVKEPLIDRFDPTAAPILSLAIADTTNRRSSEDLRNLVDDVVKPQLERVAGVAAVDVVGGLRREVHVDLKRERLEAYGIPPQQVIQAIRTENLDVPAGRVPDGTREEPLRLAGEIQSLGQLGEIAVATRPGGPAVRVKELASVAEGYAEVRALSRLDGRDSVVADVRKQSGTNTVQVADAVKRELARLQQRYPDLSFAVALDQSQFTREAVQDVQRSLLLGALLAGLVVLVFFRDLRNTLVTIAGLPVVLLGTFAALYLLGLSLNMLTMMALSLSVGMLIDDAIVVRENIFRHMERGEDPRVAAGRGAAEIALAVVAVTSTIVAVFLPIAFTPGLAGKFLGNFGLTVAVAVLISLVEAFTLAPMLSAHFFRRIDPGRRNHGRVGRLGRLLPDVNSGYRTLLAWSLRHRAIVVVGGLLAFAGSLAVLPLMVFSFVPDTDQGEFSVGLELPPGARLEETDRAARAAEQVLQAEPAVEHVFTTVGSGDGAVERAALGVKLRGRGQTQETIARLRPDLERALGGARFTVEPRSSFGPSGGGAAAGAIRGRPIQFAVQGRDFQVLDRVSADLVARLQQVPGVVDVDRSIRPGKPGRAIVLDRPRATDLGVTSAQLGTTVRALVNGERAGTYRAGDREIDIVVRLGEADRDSLANVLRLPIGTARGTQVPLAAVARLVESAEPDQIARENRQRQVVVGAGYLGRNLGSVQADARAVVAAMSLPEGVAVTVAGQARMTDEMTSSLGLALALSVLFVYMILASQFGSFVHPFTIMLALPFSFVGALLALFLAGFNFDILAMIGIILLMGLVSKNSILLVEFINQLRRRGLDVREAILEAGPIRLRPILMTTLAMIFGMIPVALGLGAGAELRRPMGVSVIGGLLTSMLLTLVVVPVAYSLIHDLGRWAMAGVRGRGLETQVHSLYRKYSFPTCTIRVIRLNSRNSRF